MVFIVLLWYGDEALNTSVHVLKRNDSCRKRQIEQLNVIKKQIGKKLLERHHVRTASSITIDPHRPRRHLSCRLHRVKKPSSKEGRQRQTSTFFVRAATRNKTKINYEKKFWIIAQINAAGISLWNENMIPVIPGFGDGLVSMAECLSFRAPAVAPISKLTKKSEN